MRARNIKPDFFKNDILADLDPFARILFVGLWCYADREGIFEWRAKKIKAEIFPYDDVDIDKLLMSLHAMSFIVKYGSDNDGWFGMVLNFNKHQHPHPHEKKSVFPKPEQFQCHDNNVTCNEMQVTNRSDVMINDVMINDVMINDVMINDIMINDTHDKLHADDKKKKKESFDFKGELLKREVTEQTASDYMLVRKQKKAANTLTAFIKLEKQVELSKQTWEDIIQICCERSWSGFKSEWLDNINFQQQKKKSNFDLSGISYDDIESDN